MLFVMVMLLGFVVLGIGYVANPENWAWFFARGNPQAKSDKPKDPNRDTRLAPPPDKPKVEGQFTLVTEPPAKTPAADAKEYYPGVDVGLLARIEDNRPLNHRETEPWINLMMVLKNNSEKELRKASTESVGFLQLHDQPHVYRGKLVSVEGTAKRAYYRKSETESDGVDQYFIIWLMPKGGPPRPIIIYCQEKPEGFPEGEDIREYVRLTGFFFKKRAYEATDTFRAAPVLLAKSFRWKPVEEKVAWQVTDQQLIWMCVGAAAFALLVVAFVHWRGRQLFAGRQRAATANAGASLASVDDGEVLPSVGEQLAEIVDREN